MIQTCTYLYSSNWYYKGEGFESISKFLSRKSISRNATHLQSYGLIQVESIPILFCRYVVLREIDFLFKKFVDGFKTPTFVETRDKNKFTLIWRSYLFHGCKKFAIWAIRENRRITKIRFLYENKLIIPV